MNDIKEEVKEKIKQYSNEEYFDGYIKNEFLTDNGKADIFLKITSKEELFDSKTMGNQLDLNNGIYKFLDSKTSILDNNIKIKLNIVSENIKKKDLEKVKHLISEHYAIELYKAQKEYKKNNIKFIKLIIVGMLFLIFYAIIALSSTSKFFIEVFGFLFSFTLWHAFETLMNTLKAIKIKRESITQKLVMDIVFNNNEQ